MQIKELEAQLLVERKLARQHVDSKIAEQFQQQHIRQQNEEEDAAPPTRLPLASKISALKTYDENKFPLNITRPLTENNSYKLSVPSANVDCALKHYDLTEKENKENNPDIDEQPVVLKRSGRASMCPIAHRILPTPAPRRNSLIPIRTLSAVPKLPPPLFPLRSIQSEEMEDADGVIQNAYLNQLHIIVLKSLRQPVRSSTVSCDEVFRRKCSSSLLCNRTSEELASTWEWRKLGSLLVVGEEWLKE